MDRSRPRIIVSRSTPRSPRTVVCAWPRACDTIGVARGLLGRLHRAPRDVWVPATQGGRRGASLATGIPMPRPFPKLDRPPVVESVLGVQFAPLELTTAHFGVFWKSLGADWPKLS